MPVQKLELTLGNSKESKYMHSVAVSASHTIVYVTK